MQTFLPFPDFYDTAKVLDYKRLGKQRVEAYQIISTLEGKSNGWKNHPAVKMWDGYTDALKKYFNTIVLEWVHRGYKNNYPLFPKILKVKYPYWLGDKDFHLAHQSNLLRKDYVYYSKFFSVNADLPYIWPRQLVFDFGDI